MSYNKEVVQDAKSITSSLHRVRKQLEANVVQAGEATSTLIQDDEYIHGTYEEHSSNLKHALKTTKRRLNSVKAVDFLEKYSVLASLLFFTLVAFYIIIKRTRVLLWVFQLIFAYRPILHGNQKVLSPNKDIQEFKHANIINSQIPNDHELEGSLHLTNETLDNTLDDRKTANEIITTTGDALQSADMLQISLQDMTQHADEVCQSDEKSGICDKNKSTAL